MPRDKAYTSIRFFAHWTKAIDTPALVRAWRRVFERHPILRTSFRWEGMHEPVQEIHRQVEVPFEVLDWRDFTQSEQQRQSDALLAQDRRQGFSLSDAPITRLKLDSVRRSSIQIIVDLSPHPG